MDQEGHLSLEELRRELRGPLEAALSIDPNTICLDLLCEPKDIVTDDTQKLIIRDNHGRNLAVSLVASPVAPDLVGRGMHIAKEAKKLLGDPLGNVILTPLGEGKVCGRDYTILPFCPPMGGGRIMRPLWKIWARPKVIKWLLQITDHTATRIAPSDIPTAFEAPLDFLATSSALSAQLRSAAELSLARLRAGEIAPRSTLMHGDLWEGNILRPPSPALGRIRAPFILIDWPGAMLQGYPFYDLIRIAESMNFSARALRREILKHTKVLGIDARDAEAHLLSSLGHIGLNRGGFPLERYAELSLRCFTRFQHALNPEF